VGSPFLDSVHGPWADLPKTTIKFLSSIFFMELSLSVEDGVPENLRGMYSLVDSASGFDKIALPATSPISPSLAWTSYQGALYHKESLGR